MYFRLFFIIFITSVIFSWFLIIAIVFSLNATDRPSGAPINEYSTSYINSTDRPFGAFLINNSQMCTKSPKVVKLLILIHSSVTHFDFREAIRRHHVMEDSITVFLVGRLEDRGLQDMIDEESNKYHDLVQGSFHDSYRNLTLKHIMAMTWTVIFCPGAQLVMKIDDDIFVNHRLLNELVIARYPESKLDPLVTRTGHNLIAGYIQHRMKVIRNATSRWFVTEQDFAEEYYPDFCSGWAYITTVDVFSDLLDQIARHALFWIDDVYVTGILRQSLSDIELEALNKFFNVDPIHLYLWVTNSSLHNYKWRHVFSNTNGDVSLLSAALAINAIPGHKKCCYPLARDSAQQKSIELKPKSVKGVAKRISV